MRNRVARAIAKIEESDGVSALSRCADLKERYARLNALVPEASSWDVMASRQLVFFLHHKYGINLGVCRFYRMNGDKKQYCSFGGDRVECLCGIPQPFCLFRDQDGKSQHPEFLPHLVNELEAQFEQEKKMALQV